MFCWEVLFYENLKKLGASPGPLPPPFYFKSALSCIKNIKKHMFRQFALILIIVSSVEFFS